MGKTPYVKKDIDRSNGTLKVGTNAEFPPYEYYEDNKGHRNLIWISCRPLQMSLAWICR